MKTSILIDMLFDFLSKRKVTAAYLAEKYDISPRTVYRYVEILSQKLPLRIKQGRNGGIYLYDSYRLPVGFLTEEEYTAVTEALSRAYTDSAEERFLKARRKLLAQLKTESKDFSLSSELDEIFIDGNSFECATIAENIQILKECIRDSWVTDIIYLVDKGDKQTFSIEPHALVYDKNIWFLYAFCLHERCFKRFSIGKMLSLCKTEENFRKRSFEQSEILTQTAKPSKSMQVRLEVKPSMIEEIANRFGGGVLRYSQGRWIAEIPFPDNEDAAQKLLYFGAEIKVISPKALQTRIAALSSSISKLYT